MKNLIKTVSDEVVSEVKDMGRIAKAQISGQQTADSSQGETKSVAKTDDKKDPITGKKPPTKQQLTDLKTKTAQLQAVKLKKVREELEKQRLKVTDEKAELSPIEAAKKQGHGPAVPTSESAEKAPDNAVANTLKGSKSTGEFKGLVGG